MPTLTLAACLLFAVIDWVAVARTRKSLEYVAKPATLALLLLYAATAPAPSPVLIAALAFSLLGDVYLMVPGNLFLAGLGAFLLGHVAYIGCFDAELTPRLLWSIAVLTLMSPVALRILRSVDDGALKAAIALYMLVIACMVGSAFASGLPLAAIGAVLFCVSDAMIAWNRFVRPFEGAATAIIVTYHLGQIGLVVALRA